MTEISGKPTQIHNISTKVPFSHKGKTPKGQKDNFGKILSEQTSETTRKTDSTAMPQELPELESPLGTSFFDLLDKTTDFTEKLSSSIDLLEKYASWLRDPEKTLKQAYGILEDLTGQTEELNRDLNQEHENSSNSDEELKKIITQITATAQVEQIKINRGDYLDLS